MTEPNWVPLGVRGGIIDYIGGWSSVVTYKAGDVVVFNGIDYLAVNPSLNQSPAPAGPGGIGTSLPASPVDGQEYILVDSLTLPTYAWRFRYTASITDAYKWVFIGGAPAYASVLTSEPITPVSTWSDLATAGPLVSIARAGIYYADGMAQVQQPTGTAIVQLGITGGVSGPTAPTALNLTTAAAWLMLPQQNRINVAAGSDIRLRYWSSVTATQFANRSMSVWPARIS